MHGPCDDSGSAQPLGWCPKFGDGLTSDGRVKIRVVDSMVRTLRPLRRAVWRSARNKALERWEAAGLKFVVEEDAGVVYKGMYSQDPADGIEYVYIPKAVRLVRSDPLNPHNDFAKYSSKHDASVVADTPTKHWWQDYSVRMIAGLVGHEFGHGLGLSHGGDGIMSGNWKPNEHDLESISRYYLGYNPL